MTEPSTPPPYLQSIEWSFTATAGVFLAGLFGALVAAALVIGITGDEPTSLQEIGIIFGAQVVFSLAVVMWLSRTQGTGSLRRDVGLTLELRHWWAVLLGLALQVGVALLVSPLVDIFYPGEPPQQEVAQIASDASETFDRLVIAVAVVVAAPVIEEIVFRGMLLSRLLRSMGKGMAVFVSAAVFSAIHLADPNAVVAVPGLFLIGLVLGYQALRSGNLSLPILTHAGVNLTAALALFFQEDLERLLDEMENALAMLSGF